MGFFILFGLILIIISVVVKFNVSFTVKENSQCPENDKKLARENKINFYLFLGFGIAFIITGIILGILCI